MKNQKIKQWIKDYLDFAMPLIMIIVALNLVDLLIDLPYYYNPERYTPKLADFFKINAHLSVFIEQVNSLNLLLYSFIFMCSALFLRLFTNRLKINLVIPFKIIWLYFIISIFINNKINKETFEIVTFIFVDGLIGFCVVFLMIFGVLKIFITNLSLYIKTISYISIFILCLLMLLAYQFGLSNILHITKLIFVIFTFFAVMASILYCVVTEIAKDKNYITVPQDIEQFEKDSKQDFQNSMSDLQDTIDSMNEKRKIKNAIKDLVDYAKKR